MQVFRVTAKPPSCLSLVALRSFSTRKQPIIRPPRWKTPTPCQSQLWTCCRCLSQQQCGLVRFQSTMTAGGVRAGGSRRRRFVIGILAAGAVLGALGYEWRDLKHFVSAGERAGRVAWGLVVCINDYRITLKACEDQPEKRERLLSACHQRCADRTYTVLEKNGSIFIKLGQHLSALGYLLPPEWTTTFIPLQDKCPVSSFESIEKMIKDETGYSIEDLFEEFDSNPIGAASLAQVHRAKLKSTGQEVAVKLQHPALAEWTPLDIALIRFVFRNIKFFFPEYPLEWLSDEIESSLPHELDFEQEAHNTHQMREHFSTIPQKTCPLIVPTVVWAKSRVLVMEFLPGKRLDDLQWIDEVGISRDEVSAALARIFNEMVFGTDAPLHCDPHGGNLAICIDDNIEGWSSNRGRGFHIILYDHGLYRDIPTDLRRNYARLWLAVLDGDEARMRKYAKEVAGVSDSQFPLFASAITGRDYTVLVPGEHKNYNTIAPSRIITTPRTKTEQEAISSALMSSSDITGHGGGAMLAQLMQLLAHVPPIILLILKTNDLTRSLDESLKTSPEAGVRVWLILARYCAKTVFDEEMEFLVKERGLRWVYGWMRAMFGYCSVEIRLFAVEGWMRWMRWVGKVGFGEDKLSGNRRVDVAPVAVEMEVVEKEVESESPGNVREPQGFLCGCLVEEVRKLVGGGGAVGVGVGAGLAVA